MIHSAIISGSIEQALFRDNDGLWLIAAPGRHPQPADHRDAAVFHNIALEVSHAVPDGMPIDLAALNHKLDHEVRFVRALRGLLVGMDPDFGEELRRKSLAAANAILLAHADLVEAIQLRMFVPTNSQEWDLAGAVRIADSIEATSAALVYRPIADGTLDRVIDALSVAVFDLHGAGVTNISVRDGLQQAGLVAKVTALAANGDIKGLKSLAFSLHLYPDIARLDANGQVTIRLTNAIAAAMAITLAQVSEVSAPPEKAEPAPRKKTSPAVDFDLNDAVSAFLEKWDRRKNKGKANEFADLEAIQREVDWIAKRLYAGELPKAGIALIQLVSRQDGRSDPDHLAKSLTNVAGHARKAKAFDFCFTILDAIDLLHARDAAAADVRAEALSELGRHDEALAVFKETMVRFPDNAIVRNGYGELLREMGRLDAACTVFIESIAHFPDNVVVRNGYCKLLRQMGQLNAACAVFEESLERFPSDPFVRSGYGELLREMGRFDASCAVFEVSMPLFPDNVVLRNGYGKLLREMGQFDAACAVFKESMARFPNEEFVRSGYGELLREMGRFDDACTVFEDSIACLPDNVVVRNGYGELLREMGQFDEACAVFEESMARFPGDVYVRSGYGELLREMGRLDAACTVFEESILLFPDNAVVRNGYGELLRDMGRFEEASAVFEESMARFPGDVYVRSGYGELLREMGQFVEACAVFEASLADFPDNVVIRNGYAQALLLNRDFAAVESIIGKIEQKNSRSDWISVHILGMSHLRKGEPEAALALFERGSRECPFPQMLSYFSSGIVMALLALKRPTLASQIIAEFPAQRGASKRALSILAAHTRGAVGDSQGVASILDSIRPENLTKHEGSLVDALTQIYVLRSVPAAQLQAANDNVVSLEMIVIFNALGRVQRMRQAA